MNELFAELVLNTGKINHHLFVPTHNVRATDMACLSVLLTSSSKSRKQQPRKQHIDP